MVNSAWSRQLEDQFLRQVFTISQADAVLAWMTGLLDFCFCSAGRRGGGWDQW
jgi:hypothetical protein